MQKIAKLISYFLVFASAKTEANRTCVGGFGKVVVFTLVEPNLEVVFAFGNFELVSCSSYSGFAAPSKSTILEMVILEELSEKLKKVGRVFCDEEIWI